MTQIPRLVSSPMLAQVLRSNVLAPIATRARGWVRKRRAKALRRRKAAALARYGEVSSAELIRELRAAGIAEGDTIFVQLSTNDMLTWAGAPTDLLSMLRELVGETGTLLMPAYSTPDALGLTGVFDIDRAPTYTGIVNEIFRRTPGVIRSLHPRHSICGLGPMAAMLLDGHETCCPADGEGSPFDRFRTVDQARIVTLGLPEAYLSFLHWVEDIEPQRFPMRVHVAQPIERRVRTANGAVRIVRDLERIDMGGRLDVSRVAKRLSPSAMRYTSYKAIDMGVYPAKRLATELVALRDAGIVHYR